MEVAYTYKRFRKKIHVGKFNNFQRFKAPLGKILRVMVSKKVREVHKHVISIFWFLNFLEKNA